MNVLTTQAAELIHAVVVVAEHRELALGLVVRRPGPSSSRTTFTGACLMADRLSATTDRPAMPNAIVRTGA